MDASPTTRISAITATPLSRRAALRLGSGALLATGLQRGSRELMAQERTSADGTPVPFAGDAFVGVTDRPDLFVAVVFGSEEERGYLCDGASLSTWFTGDVAADTHNYSSEDGAVMIVTPQGDTLEGSATLADGSTVTFTAIPAAGIAGLYEVVVQDSGYVVGAAAGGLRLEGVMAGTLPDGTLLVAGAVAAPDGGLRPLAVFATADAAGVQRWIVLDDGQVTGGLKADAGSGFTTSDTDLVVSTDEPFIDSESTL